MKAIRSFATRVPSLAFFILIAVIAPHPALALTPEQRTELSQSVGTIAVPAAGGTTRMGTCLVVSDKGFVVTSLQVLQGAAGANVVFRKGGKHEVAGFVAARKGKDLVVLALRNPKDLPPPLKFATADLAAGDAVEFIGSAAGQPYDFSQGKLVRYISGRQFLAGLAIISQEDRLDADTCWLRSDILQPPQGLGAAMLNEAGELVGMITYVREWGDRMHTALHVAHIQELLAEAGKAPPRSLAALKKYADVDPVAPPEKLARTPASEQMVVPRTSVVQQFAAWQRTRAQLEDELPTFERAMEDYQAKLEQQGSALLALADKAQSIRARLATMKPEDTKGKGEDEEDVFSTRQLKERARLKDELANAISAEENQRLVGLKWKSWIEQVGIDQAANRRHFSRLWMDLFFLADPWRLRDADTHRALEKVLTEAIVADDSSLYLARGVVRHNLQEYEQAREDFQQVPPSNRPMFSVAQVWEARLLLKAGKETEGRKLLSSLTRASTNPQVAVVQALIELDAGRFAGVERNLLEALQRGSDPAEIHRVLSLIHAAAPEGQPHSARKALEHARRACVWTAWQDSEALLALAAAQAEGGEFEQARNLADCAINLSAGEVRQRGRLWRETFEKDQRLRLAWGR